MLSEDLGPLLRSTREQLGMSREAVAGIAGVSVRLVAEFERGQRSNVSLESALRLLQAAGITVIATSPTGETAAIQSAAAERLARAARAARRRETWTVRRVSLSESGEDPAVSPDLTRRVAAVREVSETAYAFASAKRRRPPRPKKSRE